MRGGMPPDHNISSFFGERPVLTVMYTSAIRASDSFLGSRIAELELGRLARLRGQLMEKQREATTKATPENAGSAPTFSQEDPVSTQIIHRVHRCPGDSRPPG